MSTGPTNTSGTPDVARAWVNEVIGPDELVVASVTLAGATSSALYRLTTMTWHGSRRRLVLRWYPDGSAAIGEPLAIGREAAALLALAGSRVPAPGLIATCDGGPSMAGGVLMTELPGRPQFDLPDRAAVQEALAAIHSVDPAPMAGFRYRGYHEDARLDRPAWWRDGSAWERAVELSTMSRPTGPDTFIHRDFHPGNLLWLDGRLSGVVDWVNACVGPAAVDVAHCRVNLAILWGVERADELLPGDPAWDIEAALGMLDWDGDANDRWPGAIPEALAALGAPGVNVATARVRLETFVRRALAVLG